MSTHIVQGTWNGTGSDVVLCLGFVPEGVEIYALDGTMGHRLWLARYSRNSIMGRDYVLANVRTGLDAVTGQDLTPDTGGIEPYEGGEVLTAENQSSVVYGAGVYLGPDYTDYRSSREYGYTSSVIDTWTLDDGDDRSGHFNSDVLATGRIGVGSLVTIREKGSGICKDAYITSLTSGGGSGEGEVVLSRRIGSGEVTFIGGKYTFAPLPIGTVTVPGFRVTKSTVCNVENVVQAFRAWYEV